MAATSAAPAKSVHRLAWIGFSIGLVSLLLAWYGSLHAEKHLPRSPLLVARGQTGKPAEPGNWYERLWVRAETTVFGASIDQRVLAVTERSKIARYSLEAVAFGLPFVLGIIAATTGATAMRSIEQSRNNYLGNFQSVTAIMMGGFASVIAGCMIVSVFLWPYIPSLYTH